MKNTALVCTVYLTRLCVALARVSWQLTQLHLFKRAKCSMNTTSKVLVERYLKGREILSKRPDHRREEDLEFLQDWLAENISLFRHIDKGDLSNTVLKFLQRHLYNMHSGDWAVETVVSEYY